MTAIDAKRLGRLIDQHSAALELYAGSWCDAPQDVVQDAYIQLAKQTQEPTHVVPWLYRVTRNRAISVSRSARRRRRHEATAAGLGPGWFVPTDETRLDAATAAEALQSLPSEEREIIVAHLWGGLSFQQIAEVTESSSSTAHRRYQSGLAALRQQLESPCPTQR